jgi:hypothetical protein
MAAAPAPVSRVCRFPLPRETRAPRFFANAPFHPGAKGRTVFLPGWSVIHLIRGNVKSRTRLPDRLRNRSYEACLLGHVPRTFGW